MTSASVCQCRLGWPCIPGPSHPFSPLDANLQARPTPVPSPGGVCVDTAHEPCQQSRPLQLRVWTKCGLEPGPGLSGHPSPPHGVRCRARELELGRRLPPAPTPGAGKGRGAAGPGGAYSSSLGSALASWLSLILHFSYTPALPAAPQNSHGKGELSVNSY